MEFPLPRKCPPGTPVSAGERGRAAAPSPYYRKMDPNAIRVHLGNTPTPPNEQAPRANLPRVEFLAEEANFAKGSSESAFCGEVIEELGRYGTVGDMPPGSFECWVEETDVGASLVVAGAYPRHPGCLSAHQPGRDFCPYCEHPRPLEWVRIPVQPPSSGRAPEEGRPPWRPGSCSRRGIRPDIRLRANPDRGCAPLLHRRCPSPSGRYCFCMVGGSGDRSLRGTTPKRAPSGGPGRVRRRAPSLLLLRMERQTPRYVGRPDRAPRLLRGVRDDRGAPEGGGGVLFFRLLRPGLGVVRDRLDGRRLGRLLSPDGRVNGRVSGGGPLGSDG